MITVDGKAVATRVDGTVNDLNSFLPLTLSACGAPTALSAGQHAVDAEDVSTAFQVTSLTVANPLTLLADAAVPASPRSLQVARWGTVERQVEVGSGPASYLAVAENYNKGWTASLDGKTLTPVELDGWQQGWLVPPGGGGVVIMRYSADTWYRAGLAAGALLVLALLILVVAPVRRRREPPPVGPVRIPPLALGIGAGAALALIAGPLALLMIPLVILGRWRRGLLSALAPASFLAAGAFAGAIVAHHHPGPGIGALSGTAQILAVLALASVLAAAVLAMVRSPNGQVQWRRRDSSRSGLLARWGRRR
jgi:arabinofuranan 3-O-arabinosyltransferase